jgi:ureidoacrylate peracid hydrolase
VILRRGRAALLVVDMEHDFVHGPMAVAGGAALAERLRPLVDAARETGVPVVFATQALRPGGEDVGRLERFDVVRSGAALREGTDGVRVVAELGARPDDLYVLKRRFSAFLGTDLDLLLRSRGIEQVVVCGLSAHVCCDTTARDAFQLGYDPLYVTDGVAMGDLPDAGWGAVAAEEAQRVVATILAHRFATLCTVDELRAELAA